MQANRHFIGRLQFKLHRKLLEAGLFDQRCRAARQRLGVVAFLERPFAGQPVKKMRRPGKAALRQAHGEYAVHRRPGITNGLGHAQIIF